MAIQAVLQRAMFFLLLLQVSSPWRVASQSVDPASPYKGHWTEYTRPNASLDLKLDEPELAPNPMGGPEQVFLTQADDSGAAFTISWSSRINMKSVLSYSLIPGKYNQKSIGSSSQYTYADYTSGHLHHVTISKLKHNSRYYYKIGIGDKPYLTFESSFLTPPTPGPEIPFRFAVVGDLGQTYSSRTTVNHLQEANGQYLLNVGDFSYADGYQPRWDTWGRFMTKYSSKVPVVFTYGNHEIEYDKAAGVALPIDGFLSALTRFATPRGSGIGAVYYSLNVGPSHIISLNSYVAIGKYTPQYNWLQADLKKVDRSVTPWVIIVMHVPWYNTYDAHYMEGEVVRSGVEYFVRKYQVDVIFSGHVHSYERFKRTYIYEKDACAPLYITIGDGGNREGPAYKFRLNPQPDLSEYREPSFGHGTLEIFNSSLALWQWHRNQDNESVTADHVYIENIGSKQCDSPRQPTFPFKIQSM